MAATDVLSVPDSPRLLCTAMRNKHSVVPLLSWGSLPSESKLVWRSLECNRFGSGGGGRGKRIGRGGKGGGKGGGVGGGMGGGDEFRFRLLDQKID